ncbi:MAG: alpha/beta hydrolase [Betaproteobacteria bacterium]|nr:alpha/beta hydrolase [Betaproteobacteria bacterium]
MNNLSRLVVFAGASVALAVAVGACSPLRVVNALTPTDTYIATVNLAYGSGPREKLDVYRPRPPADPPVPRDGYPVVVFFYGGSWTSGARGDYRFIGEALASRGIVTVVADYRLYPEVRYPDFLTDCARALAWARREAPVYGGDIKRLFVMGHSSGAYNSAMLALDPRWLAAAGLAPSALAGWIGLAGPYDFLPMTNVDAQPVFFHPDYPAGTQAVDYVTRAAPRTFLGAATADDVVNPERNTRQLADKLRTAGVAVTLRMYPGANHYTIIGAFARPLRSLEPVLDDVVAFVRGDRAGR